MSTQTTILDSFSSRHETPSHGDGIGRSQTLNILPEGFANLLPSQRIPDLARSLLLRSEFRFTLHQNVHRTYSICDAPLSRSVQRSFDRFVKEIAPKSWLLYSEAQSGIFGFRAGVRAIS